MIRFLIKGGTCYLSQQETLTMWARCLARAGVNMSFSQGFNPHPKISLPLPRSVGVEGDEELLRVGVGDNEDSVRDVQSRLNQQLPDGCRVMETELFDGKVNAQPLSVLYVVSPRRWNEPLSQRLTRCKEEIGASQTHVIWRYGPKHKTGRQINIGTYLQNMDWADKTISVRCRFTPEGTIRVDELVNRLGLERGDLVRPVLRTKIEWCMQ